MAGLGVYCFDIYGMECYMVFDPHVFWMQRYFTICYYEMVELEHLTGGF